MSELVLYSSEDGETQMHLRVDGETIWLSQGEIAELFQTTKQNVSLHAKNILEEGELRADSVVKESLTTAADGKNYRTKLYNLDLILAIGYRVRSPRGTQFRQWATHHPRPTNNPPTPAPFSPALREEGLGMRGPATAHADAAQPRSQPANHRDYHPQQRYRLQQADAPCPRRLG